MTLIPKTFRIKKPIGYKNLPAPANRNWKKESKEEKPPKSFLRKPRKSTGEINSLKKNSLKRSFIRNVRRKKHGSAEKP